MLIPVDVLTKLKRGFKALFNGSRSKRNSETTTASQSRRQSQATKFRHSDLAPLVNADDTLVQTSYVSDTGPPVVSSTPEIRAPQIPPQQRHSTALFLEGYRSSERGSPVSEISRPTSPISHAPSPIDAIAANTRTDRSFTTSDTPVEPHEVAALPVVAQKESLPGTSSGYAEEERPDLTHEAWKAGEDDTLFVADTDPDVIGQAAPPPAPKMESIPESQEMALETGSHAVQHAPVQEPTIDASETVTKSKQNCFSEEKEPISHNTPMTREVSSGALLPMLATSGPLQDFYYVNTDEHTERYPGRMAC